MCNRVVVFIMLSMGRVVSCLGVRVVCLCLFVILGEWVRFLVCVLGLGVVM